MPKVVVTGSLAYDNIMDFPGEFKDHILPEKAHVINLSFLVEKMQRQRGGCAANIAYTLALLGAEARIVAAAGSDFDGFEEWLGEQGIDTGGILRVSDEITACCYITTDRADCQITGFYVGAMREARNISLAEQAGADAACAVIAPDDPEAMVRHCREARESGLPFLFDPSWQVTAMDGETLAAACEGARGIFVNDYEFTVLQEKTGRTAEDIRARHELVIVTYGKEGSRIFQRDGDTVVVPAAKPKKVVDPTGAGDAFRGAFVAGLIQGRDLGVCGRMGSVAAVYAIESYGTSSHRYSPDEFYARYEDNFGSRPDRQT